MRALQQRFHRHVEPFHMNAASAFWTAAAVLAALVAIAVLFFWAFATRAY